MNPLTIILAALPAYVSNSAPVLFGGGEKINARLFGENKTINGLASGVILGTLTGIVLALLLPDAFLPAATATQKTAFAIASAIGAMAGDLAGSYAKRRLGVAPGKPVPILDQLPFILAALFLGWLAYPNLFNELTLEGTAALIALTYALHLFFNSLAHRLRMKKVPW